MSPPSGEEEIDVAKARRSLEDILQDESALWTKITQTRLDEILKIHADYVKGNLGGKLASLKFLDVSYLELSDRNVNQGDFTGARCEYSIMANAKLRAANFYAADLRFASLVGADMTRADLRGACLRGTDLTNADLTEADLRDGLLMKSVHGELLPVMTDSGTSEADHAIMRETNLTRARVSNAYVVQTDLSDAILKNAHFIRADLSNAKFTGAIVDSVNMKGLDNTATRLPRHVAKLAGELQAIISDHVLWLKTTGRQGKQANLSEVNLGGLDLSEVNLSAADLSYSILKNCYLRRGNFMITDFSFADMRGANLSGADLRGAKFQRTNLAGATVKSARFDTLPVGTGRGGSVATNLNLAKMRDADLTGTDFSNANLEGADLSKTDLGNADLHGAKLKDADMTDALIEGAKFRTADLMGARGVPTE